MMRPPLRYTLAKRWLQSVRKYITREAFHFTPRLWLCCNSKLRVCLVIHAELVFNNFGRRGLYAGTEILARLRCGRICVSDCWVSCAGSALDNSSLSPPLAQRKMLNNSA